MKRNERIERKRREQDIYAKHLQYKKLLKIERKQIKIKKEEDSE